MTKIHLVDDKSFKYTIYLWYNLHIHRVFDSEIKPKRGKAVRDFATYWTLEEINAYIDELVIEHPGIVTVQEAGESDSGKYKIRGLKIHHPGADREAVVIEGTVHAREWISGATTIWIINYLLTSQDAEAQELARSFDWYIFPVGNPDGYDYTWTTNRNWRKNRRQNNAVCYLLHSVIIPWYEMFS